MSHPHPHLDRTAPELPGSGPRPAGAPYGHGHAHGAELRAGSRHKGRLLAALVVLATVMVAEAVVAFAANSLALLSDAGHMLTDVAGLAMALAAIHVADRARRIPRRTYGLYRLEVLAALANAALLFAVAVYVVVEAVSRWGDPSDVVVGPMLAVAVLGLVANLVAFALLRSGAGESLNVQGAYLEVLSDLLGSIGVIAAAGVIGVTDWAWVDPAVGVAIGLFILPRTLRLGVQALRVLVQVAPSRLDLAALEADLRAVEGVVDVHDLHVWTLTSDMDVASVHLRVRRGADGHGVLDQARSLLRDRHGIEHATLQVEPESHEGCDDVAW
ncbi:MAG TPA: cation diffusion facilitator family transporter [Acidimicrobiales bacterium]|nr:cation diffusion facilitator family transporter [Acidimicrobiales bacterium]